jgi:hypothetical protein
MEYCSFAEYGGNMFHAPIAEYLRLGGLLRDGNGVLFYLKESSKIACIWFASWGFRKHLELDYPLNPLARAIRWGVVAFGFWLAYYANNGYVRVLSGFGLGLSFLCWPNFAYHLSRLFRKKGSSDATEIAKGPENQQPETESSLEGHFTTLGINSKK